MTMVEEKGKSIQKDDLIWIQDAVQQFERSSKWFKECIRDGQIRAYKIAGDRKQYLVRSDIELMLAPRPWTEEDGDGD
ncbi:MAG: hypothetical protein H0X24_08055 [Ktedonobacterales bacterium]|nr:hypothetical protein [Ktedonobacterales bacterium]